MTGWLTADDAARALGVQRRTLYTYASRGFVRTAPGPDGRSRVYLADDVDRLRARAQAHRSEAARASGAVRWGEPVIDSAITSIDRDGPNYRGVPALELVERGVAFERVAELLWTGELPRRARWSAVEVPGLPGGHPLRRMLVAVSLAAARRPADGDPEGLDTGRDLVRLLAGVLGDPLAPSIAEAVGPADPALAQTALVVVADHELNASAFAARVAASAGADLYASVAAALATLTGPKHGGACDRVEALLASDDPTEALADRLTVGGELAGFGHRLYPDGDPRAEPLLEAALRVDAPGMARVAALLDAARALGLPPPTIDVGLVATSLALGQPPGWAAGVFAVGRCAGWIAHVFEQRQQGFLLRPRARYVGP